MTPALINLTLKYQLDTNEKESMLKALHTNCTYEFNHSMNQLRQYGTITSTDFTEISSEHQGKVHRDIHSFFSKYNANPDESKPLLFFDVNGNLVNVKSKINNYQIQEGQVGKDNCLIDLFFTTEYLTLIDVISGLMIITIGDKSNDLNGGKDLDIIQLRLTQNPAITNYRKII